MDANGTTAHSFDVRPKYMQLRDVLLDRLRSGEWRVGRSIPNEGELAREYLVSQGTVRKALDQLEHERLLVRMQGRGTFVTERVNWDALSDNAKTFIAAVGGAEAKKHGAVWKLATARGRSYAAADLRAMADGALDVAAWLDQGGAP